jgi:hypothetical protein
LKAARRILIEEMRVESRDTIYPTLRVPLHCLVRELSGGTRSLTSSEPLLIVTDRH